MIVWREKFIATGIHFLVTLLLAAVAAAVIFLLWYPDPFQTMIGGTELFLLIVGSDLALGPLISLIIYNSRKTRRQLLTDYAIVGVIQVAALVYGISTMAAARPAYIAFNVDTLYIVLAGSLSEKERADASDPQYASLPWNGPRYVAVVVPAAERNDALFEAMAGNETQLRPRYYVPYGSRLEQLRERSRSLADLEKKNPAAKPLIDAALQGKTVQREALKWLPVRHARGFWTAIVDVTSGNVVAWVNLNPFD